MKATLPPAGEPSIAAEVSNYKVSFPTDGTVPTDGRHDRRCDGDDNGKDIIVMWVWVGRNPSQSKIYDTFECREAGCESGAEN